MTTDASARSLSGLQVASMVTADGVRLDADIWTPPGEGPFPVLLMRQSYGRRLGSSLCYAHPAWYARQGFMVVVQDVRGRGTSEGVFEAFVHESQDGAEAIAWAAALPKSNGRVGMFGFSYQGTNQLLAVSHAPASLKALAPAMFGWDVRADWAREGDAFRLRPNIGWALQMGAETARLTGDDEGWASFYAAARSVPLDTRVNSRPPVLERRPDLSHYHDWIERPADDPYWRDVSPSLHLPALAARDVPALLVGGWFDTHLPGTLAAFDDMVAAGMSEVRLAVGPWTHFPWDRRVGELDFGPEAVTAIDLLQVRWFRHWLSPEPAGACDVPRMSLFQMGGDGWLEREHWPKAERLFHLAGSGRASIDQMDGRLEDDASPESGFEYLVHDPWRPAPTVGGAFGVPAGPVNRAATDARNDLLTFTTQPFDEELDFAGPIAAVLCLETDSASFDLACILSRVTADGRVYQLAEGYRRVDDYRPLSEVQVSLRATCARLAKGERLRLSIAPASYPAYPVNPGAGRSATATPRSQADIITLALKTGGEAGSRLMVRFDRPAD
jgi:putative CocE/NonD family hydrolase